MAQNRPDIFPHAPNFPLHTIYLHEKSTLSNKLLLWLKSIIFLLSLFLNSLNFISFISLVFLGKVPDMGDLTEKEIIRAERNSGVISNRVREIQVST